MEFHLSRFGRTFFEHQLPMLIKNTKSIAEELKRANDLKERELHDKQQENMDNR